MIKCCTLSIIKLAVVVCLIIGSADIAQATSGYPVLAFLPGTLENESQAYAAKMFEKFGGDYGFNVIILDSPGGDSQIQAENVNKCVSDGVKVIVVNPNDIVSIVPSLKKAKEAGVIVCLFSSDLLPTFTKYRDIFCGVDDTIAGEVAAKAFLDKFPEGAKIVEIGGQDGHDAQLKRNQGFHKIIDNSNIEVLATQNCSAWSKEDAKKIMAEFITAFGEEIDGVFCHWDNGATGIIQALENAEMEGVYIVGVDGCKNGFQQILDGKQSITIAQNFENISKKTMERARQLLDGAIIAAVNFIPLDTIGRDNISEYEMPEW